MASLIINADDLGVHPEINRGIAEAYCTGVLTSASLMVTTRYFHETINETVKRTGLPVGLHLCLTHGKAVAPSRSLADLADDEGRFTQTARKLITAAIPAGGQLAEQIRIELDAQIALARQEGIHPSHLDSDQHIHMNPAIFRIVEDLATKHGINAIRMVREPFFTFELWSGLSENVRRKNPLKFALMRLLARRIEPRIATSDRFFGLMYSGNLDKRSFIAFLHAIAGDDCSWEVSLHPGYPAPIDEANDYDPGLNRFISSPWRRQELDLLLDREVKSLIERYRINLTSPAELTAPHRDHPGQVEEPHAIRPMSDGGGRGAGRPPPRRRND